jgi:CRISPR-associated protein Cas5d
MKPYEICLEISGGYAMWTRPDTGDCPVSYPAPTYSAAKGIFESILWGPAIRIIPTRTEVCAPLVYHNYRTNYGGPLRKSGVVASGGGYQLLATVLVDVCYRLYADVLPVARMLGEKLPEKANAWDKKTTSPGHAYQAMFDRRLKRGQCYSIPFLGWKEFVPNYVGLFRDDTVVRNDINLILPSMLREVFSQGFDSPVAFAYDQDVCIEHGVLRYPEVKATEERTYA